VPLSRQHFETIKRLVVSRSGIVLSDTKMYLVESRLGPIASTLGLSSTSDVASAVAGGDLTMQELVVDALTTNETFFFRDISQFDTLRETILPSIIARKQPSMTLNIWCGATSSGQEPLSLAMLLRESFPELRTWKVNFTATDISDEMLERCKRGRFSQIEIARGLPAKLLVKYFRKEDMRWAVDDEILRMIEFKKLNLIRSFPPMPPMDLILLRNVMIYFSEPMKQAILTNVRSVLHPEGFLLLGTGEFARGDSFQRIAEEKSNYFKAA